MDDHHISKHIVFFTSEILPKIETIKFENWRISIAKREGKNKKKSQKNYVYFSVM